MHRVYKIAARPDWDAARTHGSYSGSADDRHDGFIHLSDAHQVGSTLAKHFRARSDLLLIAFDADALSPSLTWEVSRGGDLFPHYYGELPTTLALWSRAIPTGPNGEAEVPSEWLTC